MKKVEASAKTREEAIQNALKELGVEMYEVDKIEVLDEGSKGLFGFGARPVRVRLVVENMPDEPQREEEGDERPRRNNRGRGNRNQNREARGERDDRGGERKERDGNRGGRGRGRGRNDRDKGDRENKDRDAKADGAAGNQSRRGGNSEGGGQRNRGDNRKRGEVESSRGARNRNRGDRDKKPAGSGEGSAAPANGEELREDGIAADSIEPITDAQGAEAAALLEEIITQMKIEAKATFERSEDGSARLNVSSEDSAILIGRKGRNLSAMQYLVNRMISQGDTNENTERLVVDVEGYVDRRRESLQEMARSMAARAKESNRNMRLKPLSPQERRIVHLALQDDEDIRTFSLGESLYRSVVISPKGAAQPERGRGNRGGRGGRRRGGRGRSQSQDQRGGGQGRGADQDADVGTFGD
jgi:predicted RNA-binding protein Jag